MLGFNFVKTKLLQNMAEKIAEQSVELQNLTMRFGQFEKSDESDLSISMKYSWNRYKNYDSWIKVIHEICAGIEEWGLSIVPMIYKRAGFISGTIEVNLKDIEKEREKAFSEKFLEYNRLGEAGLNELQAKREKEGRVLLLIGKVDDYQWQWTDSSDAIHNEKGMITVNYLSYGTYKYKIIAEKNNLNKPEAVEYEQDGVKKRFTKESFIYFTYRGQPNDLNSSMPVWWSCLEHVLGLEKAFFDLRLNNHLYAAPKPVVESANYQDAKQTNELLNRNDGKGFNWFTRTVLAIVGKFYYAVPPEKADLQSEILEHIRAISNHTGIPAQHLGQSQDVKNKNVTENMMEGLGASILLDRQHAEMWLTELISKALEMMNGERTPYDSGAVEIKISEITAAHWNNLNNFWLPARNDGQISHETFLENVPGLDVGQEKNRLEEERKIEDKKKEENRDRFFDNVIDGTRAEEIEKQNLNRRSDEDQGQQQ